MENAKNPPPEAVVPPLNLPLGKGENMVKMGEKKIMQEKEKNKWIELSLSEWIIQPDLYALYKFRADPFEIEKTPVEELKNIIGPRASKLGRLIRGLKEESELMKKCAARAVFIDDEEYPVLLREIQNPPLFLRVRGEIPSSGERMIAVVGTRKPSSYGIRIASLLSSQMSARSFTVVSGLARGIDAAAHKAALEAGGKTVAVLGTGVDVVYPRENEKLADEIISSGALASELPMKTPPEKMNFPLRNRIISGFSCGVLVVEAPKKSGALITASYAGEQGRDVWACCGDIFDKNFRGCHALIKDGAKLCEGIDDIMQELTIPGILEIKAPENKDKMLTLSPGEEKIYSVINWKPVTLDEIKIKSAMSVAEIFKVLTNLQINGFIGNCAGGKFVRKK
ncbi:MAG: DNA-protecting protein DprA [Elusimicrobia bacterium CG08_land_8_20_14_0_20_44_26]|nr:MAG: DNA-protecting protein DprA [Elusimicrobia bacterium CG08_land_8_20_14_0_20_44_26]